MQQLLLSFMLQNPTRTNTAVQLFSLLFLSSSYLSLGKANGSFVGLEKKHTNEPWRSVIMFSGDSAYGMHLKYEPR